MFENTGKIEKIVMLVGAIVIIIVYVPALISKYITKK